MTHVLLLLLVTILTATGFAQSRLADARQGVPLFRDAETSAAATALREPIRPGERRRLVRLDLAALGGRYGANDPQRRLALDLLPGETHTAVFDRSETSLEGRTWIGRIEGVEPSAVLLTVVRDAVAGSIVWRGGHEFTIAPAGEGLHVVSERGASLAPADVVLVPPPQRLDSLQLDSRLAADDPSVIDVLAIYTPEVRQEVGSTAGVAAGIDLAIATTNMAFANSRVATRLRLVQTLERPFAMRDTCSASLASLRDTTDGNLDEVVALRDAYGADLVHLFFFPSRDCSGVAYFAHRPEWAAFALGLSVLNRNLGSAFPHEIGHNLGAYHDWFVDDTRTSAHGYVNCAAGWKDLMSYTNECAARGMRVSNIPLFANPAVEHQGQPTGVRKGTGQNCQAGNLSNPPCDADAASTLNESISVVANHRPSRFTTTSFPPRNESMDFRAQLEGKYRDVLRRGPAGNYADPEGAVVWTVEYLRYRLGQCSHEVAVDKVQRQIRGQGLPEPCGSAGASVAFPPRDQTFAFRLELERVYRSDLRRLPTESRVDAEGDVVWIQEYLRYRLTGCAHGEAVARTILQIDGHGVQPPCR
jgi:hypothetical protein